MINKFIHEIQKNKLVLLSILALLITIGFIALRSITGFGPILAAGIVSYLSAWMALRKINKRENRPPIAAIAYHLMTAAFLLWLASFAFVEFNVISEGRISEAEQGEYVIVLGAGLKGEEPSISLSTRLEKAAECLRKNQGAKVIVSGGQGTGEDTSEAEAMKRYLVGKGVEEARIIEEARSTSTRENLMFSKAILEADKIPKTDRIVVITSDYHAFRTRMLAKSLGLNVAVLPSKTPFGVYVSGCVREYFAIVNMYLFNMLS